MYTNVYYCSKCGIELTRQSNKKWIKTFCGDTNQNARLIMRKDRMYGIEVVFYERNGYWSKPYTYLSNEVYEKGSIVIVPKMEFFAIGKVTSCNSNPKLIPEISYKYITCRVDV